MRIRWSALGLALLMLIGTADSARADYLNWSYAWSMVPPSITSINGLSGVVGSTGFGLGTTDPVEAVTLSTFSTGSDTVSDDITIAPTPYTLSVQFKDKGNPDLEPKTLYFTGTMSGVVSLSNVSLSNSFDKMFDSIVLGEYTYKVTITEFKSPTTTSTGSISAQFSVEKTVPVTRTPEPSSLVLAGLVVPALVWYRRRKGRANAPADIA